MSHSSQSYVRGHLVLVVDCGDLERSARFWASVLGYDRADPPGGPYQGLVPARGQGIEVLLQRVPEAKTGKNRLHLDLRTPDLDAEVERVVALGARQLTSMPVTEAGWRWHILADPDETNSAFCSRPPRTGNTSHQAGEPASP